MEGDRGGGGKAEGPEVSSQDGSSLTKNTLRLAVSLHRAQSSVHWALLHPVVRDPTSDSSRLTSPNL